MARQKGEKRWDGISREQWLAFYTDRTVMTDLMIKIFSAVFQADGHALNAMRIADDFSMDYRALNAAVGWAGRKIRKCIGESPGRPAWEYVFDGDELPDRTYLWIMKPSAAAAWSEREDAAGYMSGRIQSVLADDLLFSGKEGNLFALPHDTTLQRIQKLLDHENAFQRRSLGRTPCCAVCGMGRPSLLRAIPYDTYDTWGKEKKGLLFCPTHGALFAAHLISFSASGKLLISKVLDQKERDQLHIGEGSCILTPFNRKLMAAHRRVFQKNDTDYGGSEQ